MTNLVSKDGKQFFEIGEDFDPQTGVDNSLAAAQSKGYQRYLDVTKDGQTTYTIPATHDSLKAATAKGYQPAEQVKNNQVNAAKIDASEPKMGAGTAAAIGASQGLGMGASDEIAAGLKGGFDFITQGKNPIQSAKEEYANQKEMLRKSAADQPVARYGTELATGLASGVGAGLAASGASAIPEATSVAQRLASGGKTGAAFGAASGFATGDDLKSRVTGAAEGAGAGALGGAAIEAAAPYVKAIPAGIKSAYQNFQTQGSVGGNAKEVFNAAKIGLRTIANEDSSGRTIKSLAQMAKDNLSSNPEFVASGKSLESLSDQDAIMLDVMNPGKSKVKDFVVGKATGVVGQKGTPEDINSVLQMSAPDLGEAASFNKRAAATELAPDAKNVQQSFKAQQGPIYGAYKEAAKQEFNPDQIKNVWQSLAPLRQEISNNPNVSSAGRNALDYAEQALTTGKAGSQFGLTEGPGLGMVDSSEAFNRTHAARQILDSAYLQAKDTGEKFALRQARSSIDDVLKSAPSMNQADTLFKQGKDFASKLFEPFMTVNKNNRTAQVDTAKLAKAFGDNDTAQRLTENIPQLKAYLESNKDVISNYDQVNKFIDDLQSKMGVAGNQRLLQRAGANPSGTGAAVLRNDTTKTGFIENLYRNPVETKRSVSNFMNQYAPLVGKTSETLNPDDQRKILKMYLWSQKNPQATVNETQSMFNKFANGEL